MPKETKCRLLAVSALSLGGMIFSGTPSKAAETTSLSSQVGSIQQSLKATNTRLDRVEAEVTRLGGSAARSASPQGTPVSYNGGSSRSGSTISHTVARGDTLSSISRQYSVGVDRIVGANTFDDPHRLRIGQQVLIPRSDASPVATSTPKAPSEKRASPPPAAAGNYTVQSGDTLSSIARRHNTSVNDIVSLNSLADAGMLRVGQSLRVPGATGSAPSRKDTPPAPQPQSKGGGTASGNTAASGEVEAPPGHGWYQVESGDNLHSISLSFGTTTRELRRLNDMKTDVIRVGQYLLVPVSDESLYES